MSSATITLKDFQPVGNNWGKDASESWWIRDTGAENRKYMDQSTLELWGKSLAILIGTPTLSLVANGLEAALKVAKIATFANFWVHREPASSSQGKLEYVFCAKLESGRPFCTADFWINSEIMRQGISYTLAYLKKRAQAALAKPIFVRVNEQNPYHFTARLLETGDDFLFLVKLIPTLAGRTLSVLAIVVLGPFFSSSARDGAKLYATFERAQNASFMLAPCFQPDATFHGLGGDISDPNAW